MFTNDKNLKKKCDKLFCIFQNILIEKRQNYSVQHLGQQHEWEIQALIYR